MQYTIRNIPSRVDKALRRRARQQEKSLNQVAVEALAQVVGQGGDPIRHHDLDFLIGTWVGEPEFDQVVAKHDRVDPAGWK